MDPRRPPLDLRQPLPSCAFFPRVRSFTLSVAPVHDYNGEVVGPNLIAPGSALTWFRVAGLVLWYLEGDLYSVFLGSIDCYGMGSHRVFYLPGGLGTL